MGYQSPHQLIVIENNSEFSSKGQLLRVKTLHLRLWGFNLWISLRIGLKTLTRPSKAKLMFVDEHKEKDTHQCINQHVSTKFTSRNWP